MYTPTKEELIELWFKENITYLEFNTWQWTIDYSEKRWLSFNNQWEAYLYPKDKAHLLDFISILHE